MSGSRSKRPDALEARFKLWVSSPEAEGVFGDGKWRLLCAIERTGSLRAAAAELEISYRKAWGDLRKAERCLGIQFIEKHRGGREGGATRLTDAGKQWVKAYARFRGKVATLVAKEFNNEMRGLYR